MSKKQSTVVNPNVCVTGREIAAETSVADRITYHAANFPQDELLTGFDMVLECDVGIYTEKLFCKLHDVLNGGSQFVIVDWWNSLIFTLLRSLLLKRLLTC